MTAQKYRSISYWMLGSLSVIMMLFIIITILAKNKFVDASIIDTLTPIVYYFIQIAFISIFVFLIISLSKALAYKEERKSLLYTSLITFMNIPVLIVFVFILLLILIGDHYRG